jgi:hypothetical protein
VGLPCVSGLDQRAAMSEDDKTSSSVLHRTHLHHLRPEAFRIIGR